jgi:hypothetical protein
MDNIEFDFGDLYVRSSDEKLVHRDIVKKGRHDFFMEKKKEMRIETRNKRKEKKKEKKEMVQNLSEGKIY